MKVLSTFLGLFLLVSSATATSQLGIRTLLPAEVNEFRCQLVISGVHVLTVIDGGQAYLVTQSEIPLGRFGVQSLASSNAPSWVKDAYAELETLDMSEVQSLEEIPTTLEERWNAAQSVIDQAKANGYSVAEAENLLEQAKRYMTEGSAIKAIDAATDVLYAQHQRNVVMSSATTGEWMDPFGNVVTDTTVPHVMAAGDLDDVMDRSPIFTCNYLIGRIAIIVALTDGGDSAKYHMTLGQMDLYKQKILVAVSYLSRVATILHVPHDFIIEYVSNSPTGTVRIQETPVKRSSGKEYAGSGNVTDWISWVAQSQGYTEGGTLAYQHWVNDKRRQHWANHAVVMLVPFTAEYDKFGLGLGSGIFWANHQGYPGGWNVEISKDVWDEGRDISGYYSVVGTGSSINLFPLAFAHEFMHHPNASDLDWYACTSVAGCEERYGEIRRLNNECIDCSGAPQDSSLMLASRLNWHISQSSLDMVGWSHNDADYQPTVVDTNNIWYWLYSYPDIEFGTPVTFIVLDLGSYKHLKTVIATEYVATLSQFTGSVNVEYDMTNEARAWINPNLLLFTVRDWNAATFNQAPSAKTFNLTSPNVQVQGDANGVRLGLLNSINHVAVDLIGGPSLINGYIVLGHPSNWTWYEFPLHQTMMPGTYQIRVKGSFAQWNQTWQMPVVIGPPNNVPIGDLNCNLEPYEIADAVLYSNYFVDGPAVFDPLFFDLHARVSEVNRDGVELTVSDLVYMIRVMTEDTPPLAKIGVGDSAYVWLDEQGLWVESPCDLYGFEISLAKVESQPSVLLNTAKAQVQGDTARLLSLDEEARSAVVRPGKTLIARFAQTPKPAILGMSASTQDGRAVQLLNALPVLPDAFSVGQNYPNPFNSGTVMRYALPYDAYIELAIFNVLGQRIKTVIEGWQIAGWHSTTWDGTTIQGSDAPSGVYFYALEVAGRRQDTKRMMLLK